MPFTARRSSALIAALLLAFFLLLPPSQAAAQNGLAGDYAQLSVNRNSLAAIKTVYRTYG